VAEIHSAEENTGWLLTGLISNRGFHYFAHILLIILNAEEYFGLKV
jgi:hypothetical protein